jgi:hypothetical protein
VAWEGSSVPPSDTPPQQQPGTQPTQQPGTQEPGTQPTQQPGTQEPGTQQPGTQPTQQPGTQEPGTQQPGTQPVTPVVAPVHNAATQTDVPQPAPVSEAMQRATQGVELTKFLLKILAGSIIILVAYLWALDFKTSDKVDELYDRVFSSIGPSAASPETTQIAGVINTFRTMEKTRPIHFSPADVSRTTTSIQDIVSRFQVPDEDASSLNECTQLVASAQESNPRIRRPQPATSDTTTPKPATSGATTPKPATSDTTPPKPATPGATPPNPATPGATTPNPATPDATPPQLMTSGPTTPPQPAGGDTYAKIPNCIRIMETLRETVGGSIDIDRLRVLRDFTKDIHENHQSLRTFWISAAQLVLVNVLLPLLTALLGYIFGRQSSQS